MPAELVTLNHDGVLNEGEGQNAMLFKVGDREVWVPFVLLREWDEHTLTTEKWFVTREGLEAYIDD